jgi:glycosyltransferase involved in cell wall biosynthesis
MRIAVFNYKVVPTNPAGSCHLHMLQGLCREHEFTVFAVEFENPCPERIRFVRVPVPTRPLAILFVAYHLVAPLTYLWYRLHTGARFDLVQMVESNLSFGDVSYAHFCHLAYLRRHWRSAGAKGLRGWLRWLDHWLHALVEPWTYRRVKRVVVPSQGLKRELEETYPFTRGKITVIHNPVDVERMRPPADFDREAFRAEHGVKPGETVLVFVALGQFERKGLPLVLQALVALRDRPLRLWVVGGEPDLVRSWQRRAEGMGIGDMVRFWGMQRDVRPFLWGADVFVFPSAYETFSLVSFQAAAAGLPLIVTPLYGVEEFMRDGETGFVVERSVKGVAEGLRRFISLSPESRGRMGEHAREAVAPYGVEPFVEAWRGFYGAGV